MGTQFFATKEALKCVNQWENKGKISTLQPDWIVEKEKHFTATFLLICWLMLLY